jgi:hypothetical protein
LISSVLSKLSLSRSRFDIKLRIPVIPFCFSQIISPSDFGYEPM